MFLYERPPFPFKKPGTEYCVIPDETIAEVLSRTDIVSFIGRHVTPKKAGTLFKGLCPFHDEKTPSFTVSPTRNTYHCFG